MSASFMRVRTARIFALAAFASMGAAAQATDLDLSLTVSGSRTAAPKWQGASGQEITALDFAFRGVVGKAATDVDSESVRAMLVNALSYPAAIAVALPSGCRIGTTPVAQRDVRLLLNAQPAWQVVTLPNAGLQAFALRFSAQGNYGDKAGAVACAGHGRLRYSY